MEKKVLVITTRNIESKMYPNNSLIVDVNSYTPNSYDQPPQNYNEMNFWDNIINSRGKKKFDALIIDNFQIEWAQNNDLNRILNIILKNIIKENGMIVLNSLNTSDYEGSYNFNTYISNILSPKYPIFSLSIIDNRYNYYINSVDMEHINEDRVLKPAKNLVDFYNYNKSIYDLDILNIHNTTRNSGNINEYINDKEYNYSQHCMLISLRDYIKEKKIDSKITVTELRKIGNVTKNTWPINKDFNYDLKEGTYKNPAQFEAILNISKKFNLEIIIHLRDKFNSFIEKQKIYYKKDADFILPPVDAFEIVGGKLVLSKKEYNYEIKHHVNIVATGGHFELLNWDLN